MKKFSLKDIFVPTVALFAISLIAALLLAATNMVTVDKIAENALEKENQSRIEVMPAANEFTESEVYGDSGITYCEALDQNKNVVGYVFTGSAKGYGGDVKVVVGYLPDGTISGVSIIADNETPGLGANATKDSFKSRFANKKGVLTVDKASNEGQNIQAITAATVTSKAVVKAVNATTEAFGALKLGGGVDNG